MATIYDCSKNDELLTGMRLARVAIGSGELVVLPTDTVYGVAADAFDPKAVQRLLDAKGRTRQAPPPVLIPSMETLEALAQEVPPEARALAEAFWPGGLTIILPARDSLTWDLGETGGTVALRMPANEVALELLRETGPLAVSSANLSGEQAARTAAQAEGMLGDSVSVYLDGGPAGESYASSFPEGTGSTIVDATAFLRPGGKLRVVRIGVISEAEVREVLDALAAKTDESGTSGLPASDAPVEAGATVVPTDPVEGVEADQPAPAAPESDAGPEPDAAPESDAVPEPDAGPEPDAPTRDFAFEMKPHAEDEPDTPVSR